MARQHVHSWNVYGGISQLCRLGCLIFGSNVLGSNLVGSWKVCVSMSFHTSLFYLKGFGVWGCAQWPQKVKKPHGYWLPSSGMSLFCVGEWPLLTPANHWQLEFPALHFSDRILIWLAYVSLCSRTHYKCSDLEGNVKCVKGCSAQVTAYFVYCRIDHIYL